MCVEYVVSFWDLTSLHTCKRRELPGWLATVPCCFLSPLPSIGFLVPLPPSSNPSIHCCSLALCGESAVTVCPSSCGPSCLSQMGPSPPHPPWATVPIRGHQNLKQLQTGPEAWKSHWGKTICRGREKVGEKNKIKNKQKKITVQLSMRHVADRECCVCRF